MANFSYETINQLIVIPVTLYGKHSNLNSRFILDTGATRTVVDHGIVESLGYSARDGIGISTVSSVVGKEQGYRLQIEGFQTLGKLVKNHEIVCHDLINQIEGLIGMSFLQQFDWCLHPKEKKIAAT